VGVQTLVYSRTAVSRLDWARLDAAPLEPYPNTEHSQFRWQLVMDEHACQVVIEDWFRDNDVEWTYWVDSLYLVVSGSAEMEIWQPPNWATRTQAILEEGSIFLCPRGARAKWHVTSDEPFRHVVVDIPNPGYSVEELAAGTATRVAD
jgi:hypothetical protein